MDEKPESRTEEETFIEEAMFNLGHHYKTTISDGKNKVEGRGNTPREAEAKASEKWKEKR